MIGRILISLMLIGAAVKANPILTEYRSVLSKEVGLLETTGEPGSSIEQYYFYSIGPDPIKEIENGIMSQVEAKTPSPVDNTLQDLDQEDVADNAVEILNLDNTQVKSETGLMDNSVIEEIQKVDFDQAMTAFIWDNWKGMKLGLEDLKYFSSGSSSVDPESNNTEDEPGEVHEPVNDSSTEKEPHFESNIHKILHETRHFGFGMLIFGFSTVSLVAAFIIYNKHQYIIKKVFVESQHTNVAITASETMSPLFTDRIKVNNKSKAIYFVPNSNKEKEASCAPPPSYADINNYMD